jgi:hypothetical protein
MFPFRCLSPGCQSSGFAHTNFYLPARVHPENRCPECGSGRYLLKVDIVHLLIHDPDGPVAGSDIGPFHHTTANRWSPACERGKKLIADGAGIWPPWFKMTTLPEAATCYDCLEFAKGLKTPGQVKGGLWLPLETADRE